MSTPMRAGEIATVAALLMLASPPAAPSDAALARAETTDPMARLRERLAEKLGAVKAPDAQGTHELRVSSRPPETPASAKAHGAHTTTRHPLHWSYSGAGAPDHWASLKSAYALCGKGSRQSPIDIRDGIAVELEPVRFDYRPGAFGVTDDGHTVRVDLALGSSITVTGRRYELVDLHFHRPSEERINGRQFDMSAHLVHKDPQGRLAIVAVLLERGGAQPLVQQIWNDLPLEKHVRVPGQRPLDPNDLLPHDRRYYTYMGSLTTPPCSEGVLWMVMQQPVPVSAQQIEIFSRLYPMNARPVQQAAGRLIKQSN